MPAAAEQSGKPSLVGMTRAELGAALARHRHPRASGQHARDPDLALDLPPRRHRLRRHDQRLQGPADRARPRLLPDPAGDRHRADFRGRHAQVAPALSAARRRPAGRDRDRLHPRGRPRHALPVEPGRLHALLHLLPHRHPDAGAQPDRRGDRRPDPARPRPARRPSAPPRAAERGGALDAPRLQRRDDGHGRAALQFRACPRRAPDRRRQRGHRACPSGGSRSRPPASSR